MKSSPTVLVFDEQVSGTAAHYSRPEFNSFLGQFDKYAFHLTASSSPAGSVTALLEHGSDGVVFQAKNGAAEIAAATLSQTAQINAMGADAGTIVGQGLGRLKVTLSAGTCTARIKVWATGRDA